jgi:hypothetical protein
VAGETLKVSASPARGRISFSLCKMAVNAAKQYLPACDFGATKSSEELSIFYPFGWRQGFNPSCVLRPPTMKLFAVGAGSSGLVIGQSNYVLLVDLEAGRELLSRSSTIAVEIIGIASFWKKTQRNGPRRLVPRPFPEAWFPFWFRASGTSVPRVQRWWLRIFPKKKPGNPGKETGLPRLSEDASAVLLREPRRTPERLGDHLFPKKKPRPQPGLSIAG